MAYARHMPLPWPELALAAFSVALGYGVFGFSGFGTNVVALPLLAYVMPLRMAVPMLLLLDLLSTTLLGARSWRQVQWRELRKLAPFLLVGMACGGVLLTRADERLLLGVLGAFLAAYALWSLLGRVRPAPLSPRWAVPAGLIGGVFTSLFGTGGVIYTVYLVRRISDTSLLRATLGVLILGTSLVRLAMFTGGGLYAQPGLLTLAAVLAPCALLGYLTGAHLHQRVPQDRVRLAIWLLLLVNGALLLWRSTGRG